MAFDRRTNDPFAEFQSGVDTCRVEYLLVAYARIEKPDPFPIRSFDFKRMQRDF